MNKILISVLSLIVFLAPLQAFACTSFGEIVFKGFVFYSGILIATIVVLLFLYKIFGGKRPFVKLKKFLIWFVGILVVLTVSSVLYSNFTPSSDQKEEIECTTHFCNPLC